MIVSPDSSNTPYNTSNLPGSPLRNIRMVQVQECSQSQVNASSSSVATPATNKYVITTKFPITNAQPTPPGIIKVSSLIPNARPVATSNPNEGITTYHTSPTQYPHIAVVTNNAMSNNNNNNDFKVHHDNSQYSSHHHAQDYSKPIHVDLTHHPQQQHQYQKYPVMDTTVASSTATAKGGGGEQDLNIGMFRTLCVYIAQSSKFHQERPHIETKSKVIDIKWNE